MMNTIDCVNLSDDDPPDQEHKLETKRKRSENNLIPRMRRRRISNETIVILDEEPNSSNNNNIIEIPLKKNSTSNDIMLAKLERIHREDELFSDFIEKCLDIENSDGMIRIINKTVIKAYEESDAKYRKSPDFKRVLCKAIRKLDTDPDYKFSHVKDFVETLRFHKVKKKVQLTTLATNLSKNDTTMNKCLPTKSTSPKTNSIVLDSDDEHTEIPTINLDDDENEITDIGGKQTENVLENREEIKENINVSNSQENFKQAENIKENQEEIKENINMSNSQENYLVPGLPGLLQQSFETDFLYQQVIPIEYDPPSPMTEEIEERNKKIQAIELQITKCKETIAMLEEAEVEDDSSTSPYILCEKYKSHVVELYKELCKLVGQEPVKRRKVRLQVLEGHPPGPVRRLESFINENIGEDGNPLFPDFCDVVKCVMVANIEDQLGWSKPHVMNEANALFTHCGRALQKQRQRREYRDLLAKVKVEAADPADEDPELMRRLERNRKVAVKNEFDLLDRYVNLQYLPPPQRQKPGPTLEEPNEQVFPTGSECQDTVANNEPRQPNPCSELISDEDSNFEPPEVKLSQGIKNTDKDNNETEATLQEQKLESTLEEPHEQVLPTGSDCQGAEVNDEPSQPSPCSELISDEDSNFEPPEVKLSQEIIIKTELDVVDENDGNNETEVKVKQEPMDIVQMLEDLGDNFTMSVIQIEDPFRVIEISSDDDESSDEEFTVEGESD